MVVTNFPFFIFFYSCNHSPHNSFHGIQKINKLLLLIKYQPAYNFLFLKKFRTGTYFILHIFFFIKYLKLHILHLKTQRETIIDNIM